MSNSHSNHQMAKTVAAHGRFGALNRRLIVLAVVSILVGAILYPLWKLLGQVFLPQGGAAFDLIWTTFGSTSVQNAALTTIGLIIPSALLAVAIATLFAWANARTDASLGFVGTLIPLASFAVPHIAMVVGWSVLGAPRVGFIKSLIEPIPFVGSWWPSIYSLEGMIFVQTITMVPFAFLVLQPAFSTLDATLEEASLTSNAGLLRTFFSVTLPATMHAVGGAFLLALIIGVGEYTVPIILGTPENKVTLSVLVAQYTTATFPPKLGEAATIGLALLVMTGVTWFFYRRVERTGRFAQIGLKAQSIGLMRLGGWKWPIRAAMVCYLVFATILPIGALVIIGLQPFWSAKIRPETFTLDNIKEALSSPYIVDSIVNSFNFAVIGAVATVVIVMFLTSAAKIAKDPVAQIGLSVVKVPSAIASVVLALGLLLAFFGPPFSLGNTSFLLIGAYVLIFLPHSSILGETATALVRQELIDASETSGASWFYTHRRVLAPLTAPAFLALVALVFAMMSSEVNVSRIIAGPGIVVAGYTVIQVYEVGKIGQVAMLCLALTVLNFAMIAALMGAGRLLRQRW